MNRRQFKILPLKQLREFERERARERLHDLVNPGTAERQSAHHYIAENHPLPEPDGGLDVDTRQITEPVSGPLTDRIRTIRPELFEAERSQVTARAVLHTLDGAEYCEIPCSEHAGVIIVGRGQNATVRIDDPYVHRVHAHLRWNAEEHAHIIAHGGGENSTYVNRQKVTTPVKLPNGARLRVGRTELIYQLH